MGYISCSEIYCLCLYDSAIILHMASRRNLPGNNNNKVRIVMTYKKPDPDNNFLSSNSDSIFVYGNLLRESLLSYRYLLGGQGDILINLLTKDEDMTFIRMIFTQGTGRVSHSHNDPEWQACYNWLCQIPSYKNDKITPGRIVISGDLCVITHDTLDKEQALTDAQIIIEALMSWHGKDRGDQTITLI